MKEGLDLQTVAKPLYLLIRDQGYKFFSDKFVRRDEDHPTSLVVTTSTNCSGTLRVLSSDRTVPNDNASPQQSRQTTTDSVSC